MHVKQAREKIATKGCVLTEASILVDLEVIKKNAESCLSYADAAGVDCAAVIKASYAFDEIVGAIRSAGIGRFWISSASASEKISWSRGDEVGLLGIVANGDWASLAKRFRRSVHSCRSSIGELSDLKLGPDLHAPFLSIDVGDLRDGLQSDELTSTVKGFEEITNNLGILMNFGCCDMAMPTNDFFCWLSRFSEELKETICDKLLVSLGGSVVLDWVIEKRLPACVSEIRIGEAILNGKNPHPQASSSRIGEDAIVIQTTAVEVSRKLKAQGQSVAEFCRGPANYDDAIERVIVNVGTVHTDPKQLTTSDFGPIYEVDTYCGEYSVFKVPAGTVRLGDQINFRVPYIAMSRALVSTALPKVFM